MSEEELKADIDRMIAWMWKRLNDDLESQGWTYGIVQALPQELNHGE